VEITAIGDIPQNIFIDMELCDLNLDDFIYCKKDQSLVPTYFVKNKPPPLKSQQICHVMWQISQGIEFLHRMEMVHRDLKPANGIRLHYPPSNKDSPLFPQASHLEGGRLRYYNVTPIRNVCPDKGG
jgi:hypothetical protein